MSLQEEVELLRKVPLFAKIELSKLKLLAFTSDRMVFVPGEVLFKQGEAGDFAYLIMSGTADVSVKMPTGQLSVATLGEHEIVGEIAMLCDVPRTATVTVITELVTLRISKDLFMQLIEEFPQMAVEIMRELARRLEVTTVRLREAVATGQADSDG